MRQINACIDILLSPEQRELANSFAIRENDANWQPGAPTRFWRPGRTLRIRFLDGAASLQDRVWEAASGWMAHTNLSFVRHEGAGAEIRISFTPGATWSAIGTDALVVPQDQPTANIGWLGPPTEDRDLRAVVLHLFGHVLGLAHEHQSPPDGIPWDRDAVYRYYASLPAPWTPEQVNQHLFDACNHTVTQYPAFDPQSIMTLPIPGAFTIDGFTVEWALELTTTDAEFIARQYQSEAHGSAEWASHEYAFILNLDEPDHVPKNGGGTATSGADEVTHRELTASEVSGGGSGRPEPSSQPATEGEPESKSITTPGDLRLDVAVPERAQVDRAFQIAVAVRQFASPPLVQPDLPVVSSGEAQVVWQGEPFIRLRIEVSAPECTFHGPHSQTFRLFRQKDSPVFRFNLTPNVVGTINIIVNLYQEEDALGSAGTNTFVSEQPVGDVKLRLQSAQAATKPGTPRTMDDELDVARRTLRDVLSQIYVKQASIERIVRDCGLSPNRIAFDSRADNTWSSVITEAVLEDKIEALITVVHNEYPAMAALQDAIATYRNAAR